MALPDAPGAKSPAYSLETNNLTNLVTYNNSPAGLSINSAVALQAGALFAPITTSTPADAKRWSTVQTGRDSHMELNSALLYMNHSCNPSLEVDVQEMVVRVARGRDLEKGDELTFFYPSTEWDFAGPFRCLCAEQGCLGEVKGAKHISAEDAERWWFNQHIRALMQERDAK